MWVPVSPHSPNTCYCLFDDIHLIGCEILLRCTFDFHSIMTNDVYQNLEPIGYLYSYGIWLFISIIHFLTYLFIIELLMFFINSRLQSLIRYMICNISPILWAFLSFAVPKFLILIQSTLSIFLSCHLCFWYIISKNPWFNPRLQKDLFLCFPLMIS